MTDPKDILLKSCEELRLSVAELEAGDIEGTKKWLERIKLHKLNLKKWKI